MERRRRAFAELIAHPLAPEIFLPQKLAVHVVGEEPTRLKKSEHLLSVGHSRARRPRTVVWMRSFVGRLLARGSFPEHFSAVAIDGKHDEAMDGTRRKPAPWRMRFGNRHSRRNRGQYKNPVAPDD